MDALELIKADHQRLDSLFDLFQSETGRQQQILLFQNIRRTLDAHILLKETVLYPAFKNYPECKSLIEHFYQEHGKLKNLVSEISKLSDDSSELVNDVSLLGQKFKKHTDEEESTFFPIVRKLMKRAERERLGRHMEAAKAESAAA